MKLTLKAMIVLTLAATPAMAADDFFYWVGGDETWFDGDNWFLSGVGTGAVPNNDAVWVNNGGTATANSIDGSFASITRFNVASADSFTPGPAPTGTSTVNLSGLDPRPLFEFRVGYNDQGVSSSFTGQLFATGTSLYMDDLYDTHIGVGVGDLGGSTVTGVVQVDGALWAEPNIANTSRDLYIGHYNPAAGHTGNAVGSLTAGQGPGPERTGGFEDIFVGYVLASSDGASADGTLIVTSGGLQPKLDSDSNGFSDLRVGIADGLNANAVGVADITGDVQGFNSLAVGKVDGNATTFASGHVTLRQSYSIIKQVRIAELDSTLGNVEGTLVLNPSLLETERLRMYDNGTLRLHLEGTTRITSTTVGKPGTYAAVNLNNGGTGEEFDGTIIADFDFTPTAGSHTFDLIIADTLTGLDTSTMLPGDFQVVDLNPGFTVDFFGIVEDGTDIVRLTISGAPAAIPEPGSLALLGLGGLMLLKRKRT